MMTEKPKKIIGTVDCIDFPKLGMMNVPCKVDTGADTSSIHCEKIHLVEKDGIEHLAFILLDPKYPQYTGEWIHVAEFKEKRIKSSFGDYEFRFQVRLHIRVFGETYQARFTLTARDNMKYPILLGKRFLKNRYLVDVSHENLNLEFKTNKLKNNHGIL
jgi:hypothetical protein